MANTKTTRKDFMDMMLNSAVEVSEAKATEAATKLAKNPEQIDWSYTTTIIKEGAKAKVYRTIRHILRESPDAKTAIDKLRSRAQIAVRESFSSSTNDVSNAISRAIADVWHMEVLDEVCGMGAFHADNIKGYYSGK